MSDSIIKVEGLGKKYIISHEGGESYTALRDVISSRAKKLIKREQQQPAKEEFWALKDISFEVKKGEAIGIIGRNGAGKSTLLKILSRITEPTHGRIEINGRVASLLEVGTGFHPELTGRENIFLNGAILGMSRAEIKRKFDEMVDFSGVEKFLDTPVKRYSSGMYVRLAFAVAAHLEPEILVVDEVLAVGDAEFQKKCLGKMEDVSKGEGRTVLFVSHNMTAIRSLCSNSILLKNGKIDAIGNSENVLNKYISNEEKFNYIDFASKFQGNNENEKISVLGIEMVAKSNVPGTFEIEKSFNIIVHLNNKSIDTKLNVNLFIYSMDNVLIFPACSHQEVIPRGYFDAICRFPPNFFNDNSYSISIMVVEQDTSLIMLDEVMQIEGVESSREGSWHGKFPGQIRPTFDWQLISK